MSNEKSQWITISSDTVRLDSMSIIPGSFFAIYHSDTLQASSYGLNNITTEFFLNDTSIKDSILLSYRVFPVYLAKPIQHKTESLVTEEYHSTVNPYVIGGTKRAENLFDDKGLQKSGSVSRGILFGNNQNLSVNSTLNLQLSGKISDKFSILASVTDDNIPLQPEGNTQQLQDFDQVFIQLYDDQTKLIAGDFQLRRPHGYFMNYFKRAQGAYFINTSSPGKKNQNKLTVEASASISKGRFARNVIQGVEGNQGPYRLQGADNELFIIVLAGTEQVYIDGKILERGLDKDYVIDYNASEIVFTPRQFITKDRRIVVEFQYSEKRYARPLLHSSIVLEKKRSKFYLNLYSENDARNQPLQQDLTTEDKVILASSGDSFLAAYRSGIDSTGYSNTQVLYALTDSLGFDSVFVFSTDSLNAFYRVSFSPVGLGNGDYVEDGFTSNGKKYKWVQPLLVGNQLVRQGNYAPVILLAAPKKNQMITMGSEFFTGVSEQSKILVEGAISNRDLNTFSSLDSRDDVGFAFRAIHKWNQPLGKYLVKGDTNLRRTALGAETSYEYTGQHFNSIERFREVEFSRNWNVQNLNIANDQHIGGTLFNIRSNNWGSIAAGGDFFLIGENYQGYRARLNTNIATPKKWSALMNSSYLVTTGQTNSSFLRHRSTLSKEWGAVKIYFRDEHEKNLYFKNATDTLSSASYQFYDWEAGIGTADTTTKTLRVYYRDRIDNKPADLNLAGAARADQYGFLAGLKGTKGGRLSINVSNRRLRVIDPELFTQSPENTLLTRIEYSFKLKDGFLQNTTFYEVGSGLEQRKEFIYLEVPAGQGVYVWNDYDGDNVKDLNEFEIARFGYEANYIRSSVQTNDYIKTYSNQFSQSVNLNPSRILKADKRSHRFFSRFSMNSSYRVDRKTTRENKDDRFNPFVDQIADSSLMSINGLFRNALFFNKANPSFGMDYTYQFGRNKNLLSNGFESRGDDFNQLGLRWNFIRQFTLFVESKAGKKSASSDFLSGRNFSIEYYSVQPKFTWQPDNASRLNLLAQYSEKSNNTGIERTIIKKLGADFTLNSLEKGSVQAEVNFYAIEFNGDGNNSLAFEMLEGLSAGYNFTWSIGVQRTVAKNLQLNLQYNARKPEDRSTIHSGGVQIRALF